MEKARLMLSLLPLSRRCLMRGLLGGVSLLVSSLAGGAPAAAGHYGHSWVCTDADCDPYIYDPAVGDPENIADPGNPIPPGTAFEDLPESWLCPVCGTPKSEFIRHYEVGAAPSLHGPPRRPT